MKRRQLLQAAGATMALALVPIRGVRAAPEDMALAIKHTFGSRPIQEGRVLLDLPKLAENGNVVPVTVTVESPMSAQDHVKAIHLFSEKNPLPDIVEFRLGPHNGKARVSTRIRLADTQRVIAVADLSDGSLWSASVEVVVTITGCG
ncbi:MAG: SoxY-related AACIE arm protein [Burkholderiales bacterium]